MPLNGVSKICQQCTRSCKQWSQCTPVVCAYVNKQKFASDKKRVGTHASGEIGGIGPNFDHN